MRTEKGFIRPEKGAVHPCLHGELVDARVSHSLPEPHGLSSLLNGENEVRCTVKEKIEFGGIWGSFSGGPWYSDFPSTNVTVI